MVMTSGFSWFDGGFLNLAGEDLVGDPSLDEVLVCFAEGSDIDLGEGSALDAKDDFGSAGLDQLGLDGCAFGVGEGS